MSSPQVMNLDDEEMKRLREEKMRKAAHPKYNFTKFVKIRNPDDFAKSVLLQKKKVRVAVLLCCRCQKFLLSI
jgi:hypothetical protein